MIYIALMPPRVQFLLAQLHLVRYTARQVLETPNNKRSNRHVSAVLSCPEFHGFGQDEANGNAACTTYCVFRTSCPPAARRKANGGFFLNKESETMAIQAVRKPAQSTPASGTIPAQNLTAVLAAYNASTLASSYIERGNFAAARRKLVLALRDIETLTTTKEVQP